MSYRFNSGSSESISYGNVSFATGASRISGHCWVRVEDVSVDRGLFHDIGTTLQQGFMLFMDVAGPSTNVAYHIFTATAGGGEQLRVSSPTNSAIARRWQSVGWTWNLTTSTDQLLRLYLDGREVPDSPVDTSGQSGTNPAHTNPLSIGVGENANRYMDGSVAEVAIWVGRTLTAWDFRELSHGATPDDDWFQIGLRFYTKLKNHTQDTVGFLPGSVSGARISTHPPNVPRFNPRDRLITILAPQAVGGLTGQTKQAGRAGGQAGMAGGQAA